MITASNSGGSTNATVTITVNDRVANISYSPDELNLTKGVSSSELPLEPNNTGGDVVTWEINASLPNGLFFGSNNGTIYGTPTELWTQTPYKVWANNSGGSSVDYLNITVVDVLANFAYNPSNYTVVRGYTMSNITTNNTGGDVVIGLFRHRYHMDSNSIVEQFLVAL